LDEKEKAPSGNGSQDGTPQTGSSRTEPAYAGFDDLLYYGVSSFQVSNLRFALGSYAASSATPITSITIADVAPEEHDRFSESTISIVNFTAIVNNREPYLKGTLEIHDLSTIRLYLRAQDGTTIYDSQIISHKESPSYDTGD
jgi:hypothetical protein